MPPFSPWKIIAALLIIISICAASLTAGHGIGKNAQKAEDQAEFDKINSALTAQKALAQAALNSANEANAKRRVEVGKTIAQLEKTHAENQNLTDRNRTLLDAYQLRWKSSESAGRWGGGASAEADTSGTASDSASSECQLPTALAESLGEILFDADKMRVDCTLGYDERRSVTCY